MNFVFPMNAEFLILLKLESELKKRYYLLFHKRMHESDEKIAAKWIFIVRSLEDCLANTKDVVLWFDWISWISFKEWMMWVLWLSFHVLLLFKMRESACVYVSVCGENIFILLWIPWLACCTFLVSLSYHFPVSPSFERHCFDLFTTMKNCVGHEFFNFVYRRANPKNKTFKHSHFSYGLTLWRCVVQTIEQASLFDATKKKRNNRKKNTLKSISNTMELIQYIDFDLNWRKSTKYDIEMIDIHAKGENNREMPMWLILISIASFRYVFDVLNHKKCFTCVVLLSISDHSLDWNSLAIDRYNVRP